jgi:tetratricopeptide (TPR) repeat protein
MTTQSKTGLNFVNKILIKSVFLTGVITMGLFFSPLAKAQETETQRAITLYNQGVDQLETSDYQGAIASFTDSLAITPDADAYYNRGYVYHILGNYNKAIEDYGLALNLKADFASAFGNRCYAYYLLENYPSAIADCEKAVSLQPQNANFYIQLGNARDDSGDHQGAILNYDQAIKLDPNNAQAFYNRALGYNRLEFHNKALEDYNQCIRLNSQFPEAYYNRGVTYYKLNQIEEALTDLRLSAQIFSLQGYEDQYQTTVNLINQLESLKTN